MGIEIRGKGVVREAEVNANGVVYGLRRGMWKLSVLWVLTQEQKEHLVWEG